MSGLFWFIIARGNIMNWTTIIVAAITSCLGAIVVGFFNRKNLSAEKDKLLAEVAAIHQEKEDDSRESMVKVAKELVAAMQARIDKVHTRLAELERRQEEELKARDIIIENQNIKIKLLTKEIELLQAANDKLEKEREQQLKTNRSQGQKIHELKLRINELEKKSNGNAK